MYRCASLNKRQRTDAKRHLAVTCRWDVAPTLGERDHANEGTLSGSGFSEVDQIPRASTGVLVPSRESLVRYLTRCRHAAAEEGERRSSSSLLSTGAHEVCFHRTC